MAPIRESIESLRRGGLRGWSYSWFGGYPRFYFYFPLPTLAIAGLASVLPLAVAVMLVVLAGPFLTPLAAGALVVATGGTSTGAVVVATGSAFFLLSHALGLAGGTLEAAVVGEFSYGLAFPLGLLYLASLPPLFRRRTASAFALSSLLLAGTALSHVLVTGVVVLASTVLARKRDGWWLIGSWVAAFCVSAWWTLPFLWYRGEMSSLHWGPLPAPQVDALLYEGVPAAVLAVLAFAWRGPHVGRGFYRVAGVFIAASMIPLVVPDSPIYRARLMPFAFLAISALAVLAVLQSVEAMAARRHRGRAAVGVLGLGALLGLVALRDTPRRAAEVIFGGTASAADTTSWRALLEELDRLPPGAVLTAARFEPDGGGERTARLLGDGGFRHLAGWTGRRIIGGLWQESGRSSPYVTRARANLAGGGTTLAAAGDEGVPDAALGVRQARLLGARFIVLAGDPRFLARAILPGTLELARDSIWRLYEIHDAAVALGPGLLRPVPSDSLPLAAAAWFRSGGREPLPVSAPGSTVPAAASGAPVRVPESAVRLLPGEIRVTGRTPVSRWCSGCRTSRTGAWRRRVSARSGPRQAISSWSPPPVRSAWSGAPARPRRSARSRA